LRLAAQGRGIHKQQFPHYEEVPHEVAGKIIQEYEKSTQAKE
jgi:translation elongation factor EF-G